MISTLVTTPHLTGVRIPTRANNPITITFKLSRETKNTYRYDAVDENAPVGNIYIQKRLCRPVPHHIWSLS